MISSWKWKFAVILGSILLSLYALVPSILGPQKFFPEKGLNLGLDLRGGIYVEMEVLVDDGMKSKLNVLSQELSRELKRNNAEPTSWTVDKKNSFLDLTFKRKEELDEASQNIEKNYRTFFQKSERTGENNLTLHLNFSAQYLSDLRKDILAQAVQAVRNRIDRYGLAEPTVQRQGETRLVVELPGIKDPERALKIIKQAGKLEFKIVNNTIQSVQLGNWIAEARKNNNLAIGYSAEEVAKLNEILKPKLPEKTEVAFEIERDPVSGKVTQAKPYLLDEAATITGEMLKDTQVQFDPRGGEPYVSLTFNPTGAKNFGDLTSAHVKDLLAILLDGNVMSAPQIKEPITSGECRIDLGSSVNRDQTLKEAKDLTLVLQEGALPARLKELTKSVIGPTLGQDSIDKSLMSMIIAGVIILFFMVAYYNLSGLLANLALLLNTLFTFALLAMFQATLTLPGMAGIILSIGMSVDANILIFERIREELAGNRSARESIDSGYKNALRAIMDSNLTTIIAAIILYQYGTGPIRGFAVTLMIGLVCNLYTAVFITRTVYDYFVIQRKAQRLSI